MNAFTRYFITFIILTAITGEASAQHDSIPERSAWGIDLLWNPNVYYYNAAVPSLTFTKGMHTFAIGPAIWINSPSHGYEWKRAGMELMYRLQPNPPGKRFDLFFFYQLGLARITNIAEGYWYSGYPNTVRYMATRSETTMAIMNNIGYGFKAGIYKGLYVHTGIGAGIGISRIDRKMEVPDAPYYSYDIKGNFFAEGDFTAVFDLGIGIDLNTKK